MLVNTRYFQEEARRFTESGEKDPSYCRYQVNTFAYREYWDEQHKRCMEGYKVGDLWIPGPYYFYLNFVQILGRDEVTGRKTRRFPRFTDVDLEYFLNVERARKEEKGIAILKPRRVGFTYKSAVLCVHEYNFHRDSRTIIGAFESKLSYQAMSYIADTLNHIDKHTPWRKQRNPDTKDFIKARFKEVLDGKELWSGYQSEIHCLTFRDNPFAAIGKTAGLFIFDEAGKFTGLINSYNISEPCWHDGTSMTGIPILQGTGGDMEGGTQDFYEMFYNPDKYNLLTFDNSYDAGRLGSKCGWFVPASRMRFGNFKDEKGKEVLINGKPQPMVDEHGNSQIELAVQSVLNWRTLKAKGHDMKALNDAVTQYPLTPSDAFLITKGNNFPTAELNARLTELDTNDIFKNAESIGDLVINSETGKIEWKLNPKKTPLDKFPLRAEDSKEGGIVIYEHPFDNNTGMVPNGLYLAGIDTFDHNQATTDSLGSIMVYNKLNKRIVAEYTGRPHEDNLFYENCRKLLLYYNAKGLYENNWKGLFTYFEHKHSTWLLADQPKVLRDVVMETRVERKKGMHMTKEFKAWGDDLIRLWLLEKNGEDTSEILNLHKLRSRALIQELVSYNLDGNFDRVDALRMLMIVLEDTRKIEANAIIKNERLPAHKQAFFDKFRYLMNPFGEAPKTGSYKR